MTVQIRAIAVKQLPEVLDIKHKRLFFKELESCMNVDRPFIVLDCSRVKQMNRDAIQLLLCCLEEAMKRSGDVKLASISKEARSTLELNGVGRLFEMFDTNAEAVNSFRRVSTNANAHTKIPNKSKSISEHAA
jgi:anti-anti-sigma factor